MKVMLESTTKIVIANGVECRVWEGESEHGVKVAALITLISVRNSQDTAQFELELRQHRAPTAESESFPLRMIL